MSFVRSIIEYGSQIWSPFRKKDSKLLESVQRKFLKRLPGQAKNTYEERLKILNPSTLKTRKLWLDLQLFYKIINFTPSKLELLSFHQSERFDLTKDKFIIKGRSNNILSNEFSVRVVPLWNNTTRRN